MKLKIFPNMQFKIPSVANRKEDRNRKKEKEQIARNVEADSLKEICIYMRSQIRSQHTDVYH